MNKNANCCCKTIRSVAHLDIQYAHRFYGFKGEAQYLHGHTGGLTLEVEDAVNPGVNTSMTVGVGTDGIRVGSDSNVGSHGASANANVGAGANGMSAGAGGGVN